MNVDIRLRPARFASPESFLASMLRFGRELVDYLPGRLVRGSGHRGNKDNKDNKQQPQHPWIIYTPSYLHKKAEAHAEMKLLEEALLARMKATGSIGRLSARDLEALLRRVLVIFREVCL